MLLTSYDCPNLNLSDRPSEFSLTAPVERPPPPFYTHTLGHSSPPIMVTRGSKSTFPKSNPSPSEAVLFEVDTKGSESIRHDVLHGAAAARARKGTKPLKADEILNQSSKSPTPALCSRVRSRVSNESSSNQKVRLLSHKDRQRLHKIVIRKNQSTSLIDENRSSTSVAIRPPSAPEDDIWDTPLNSSGPSASISTVKPPPHLRHNDTIADLANSFTTPLSMAPGLVAIPNPHPGQSYNPTFTDHQDVLNLALEKLEEEQREADRAKEVKDRMTKSLVAARAKEQWEFCEEEVDRIEEDMVDAEETSGEEPMVKKAKKNKKKTTAQRNRKAKAIEEVGSFFDITYSGF